MDIFRVGIFGAALTSVNYGCTALALTQISLIDKIAQERCVRVEYWVFSDETEDDLKRIRKVLGIDEIYSKYVIRIKTGISGLKRLKEDIEACDLIIDITYGDSFSDIYGMKFFLLYSIPKYYAIKCRKPFILAPQTVGPFNTFLSQRIAGWILNRTDYIFTRDLLSWNCVKQISNNSNPQITSDLAMNLPYIHTDTEKKDGKLQVGLNVSSLLWEKDGTKSKLALHLSYRELTNRLLEYFEKKGYCVHLIAHVYEDSGFNEYKLAQQLNVSYPISTVLAPAFMDPIEAKSYMATLDVMIGARMHATIGAFSSGVPVIPIAYSRKFEGLYSTIGYDYLIDCNKESVETALEKIDEYLDVLPIMRADREKAYEKALNMNKKYIELLGSLIASISFGEK